MPLLVALSTFTLVSSEREPSPDPVQDELLVLMGQRLEQGFVLSALAVDLAENTSSLEQ